MSKEGRPIRCAVYTRKSTDEGLDKAFNSLDAQREACTAYVMSQQHEGMAVGVLAVVGHLAVAQPPGVGAGLADAVGL